MKQATRFLATTVVAGATILLSGCCRSGAHDVLNPLLERDGSFSINASINTLRMTNDTWESGDALGVFALQPGSNTLFGTKANLKYTTADATGKFVGADGGFTLEGAETADIVAYYPFGQNVGQDMVYALNVADQTNLAKIDLLRGKVGNITAQTKEAQMTFDHKLALLDLSVIGENLNAVTATVAGLKTDGSYNIATDAITPGSTTGTVTATLKNGKIQMILIPGQNLEKITFKVNNKEATHTLATPVELKSGYKYSLKFEVGPKGTELKIASTNINPWTEGITDHGTIELPLDDTTNPGTGSSEETPGGATPQPGQPEQPQAGSPLFPGSDFEDWDAFTNSVKATKSYALKTDFATQVDGGRNGKALKLSGTRTGNDVVFTVTDPANIEGKHISKVTFFVKGTSASKSIVVQLSDKNKNIKSYSVKDIGTTEVVVNPVDGNKNNVYTGVINTNGNWTKIILDTSSFEMGQDKYNNIFTLRVGKASAYDLMIDDITFE